MLFLVQKTQQTVNLGIGDAIRNSLDSFMDENINLIFSYTDVILQAVIGIAFCGAVVRIFQNYYNSPDNYLGYISYIPLLIFLWYYGALAEGIYRLGTTAGTPSSVKSGIVSTFYRSAEYKSEEFSVNFISTSISVIINEIKTMIFESFVRILLIVASIISALCFIYIKFKILLKLMVLVFFGPINISLSFIPSIGNLWVGWLMKVIEISLYIPVLYFLEFMNDRILEQAFKPRLIEHVSDVGQSMTNGFFGIAFYIITIFSYLSIPKVVSWAMNTASANFGGVSGVVTKGAMLAAKIKSGGIL